MRAGLKTRGLRLRRRRAEPLGDPPGTDRREPAPRGPQADRAGPGLSPAHGPPRLDRQGTRRRAPGQPGGGQQVALAADPAGRAAGAGRRRGDPGDRGLRGRQGRGPGRPARDRPADRRRGPDPRRRRRGRPRGRRQARPSRSSKPKGRGGAQARGSTRTFKAAGAGSPSVSRGNPPATRNSSPHSKRPPARSGPDALEAGWKADPGTIGRGSIRRRGKPIPGPRHELAVERTTGRPFEGERPSAVAIGSELRRAESNHLPPGYEPGELPVLYSALHM